MDAGLPTPHSSMHLVGDVNSHMLGFIKKQLTSD
jgi:hypothetical protein